MDDVMIATSCSLPTVLAAVAVAVLAGVVFAALTVHHGRRTVARHEQTLAVLRDLVVLHDGPLGDRFASHKMTFNVQGLAAEAVWERARVLTGVPRRHDALRVVADEERKS